MNIFWEEMINFDNQQKSQQIRKSLSGLRYIFFLKSTDKIKFDHELNINHP